MEKLKNIVFNKMEFEKQLKRKSNAQKFLNICVQFNSNPG